MKRLLDCRASDFRKMSGQELKGSIHASEGRVIVSEVILSTAPVYSDVTNAELACSFGADLVLCNLFDVNNPVVNGMENTQGSHLLQLKEMVGRPIGINLEPVDKNADGMETLTEVPSGRICTVQSIKKALELGFVFFCLTGNPKSGVTHNSLVEGIQLTRKIVGKDALIFAGKMHGAGVYEGKQSQKEIEEYIVAGADVILLPAPGTVPGYTVDDVKALVDFIHHQHILSMLTIGTSQEGASEETIRMLALYNKMCGADLHHIGDAGFTGIAIPENIYHYSVAIRGKRHTYIRMAQSILR
ncbi:hypothetical protein [Bacillus coahuilensis]|uniref:DUF7916 family protein n=1 Tax=Bacillus coahuilensis TaxID=408580 RepID=UPI00031E856C|nr:hypothetical protein [Bacillus coahuilensis]